MSGAKGAIADDKIRAGVKGTTNRDKQIRRESSEEASLVGPQTEELRVSN
jgi:hypothetical protein